MRIEEIALRQEIRQMLNEAGINKNTLKDMVKEVLAEEIRKAITQAYNESNVEGAVKSQVAKLTNDKINTVLRNEISGRVNDRFYGMRIKVEIDSKE